MNSWTPLFLLENHEVDQVTLDKVQPENLLNDQVVLLRISHEVNCSCTHEIKHERMLGPRFTNRSET